MVLDKYIYMCVCTNKRNLGGGRNQIKYNAKDSKSYKTVQLITFFYSQILFYIIRHHFLENFLPESLLDQSEFTPSLKCYFRL